MDRKKIFIILGGILGLIVLFFVFAFLSRDKETPGAPIFNFPFLDNEGDFVGDIEGDPELPDTPIEEPPEGAPERAPRLRKLSDGPSSGGEFLLMGTTSLRVRFTEKNTGHLFESPVETVGKKRISNTTIPAVHEAFFASSTEVSILRFLDEQRIIKTFVGSLFTQEGEEGRIVGSFLDDEIESIALSPEKDAFFYLLQRENQMNGYIYDIKNKVVTPSFSHPFFSWLPQWTERGIFLTTKPSNGVAGFSYLLDKGILVRALGHIPGLSTLFSPDGTKVIYDYHNRDQNSFATYDLLLKAARTLPLTTLAEKCVFESTVKILCAVPESFPRGTYPDVWYKGDVSFSDSFWGMNLETGALSFVLTPEEPLDVVRPILSPNRTHILFTNKKDSSVWLLRIEE